MATFETKLGNLRSASAKFLSGGGGRGGAGGGGAMVGGSSSTVLPRAAG